MRPCIACLLLLISWPAAAQIYKYTDANGNTAYSNQPPDGTKAEAVVLPPLNSVDSLPAQRNNAPAPQERQAAQQPEAAYQTLELTDLPTDEALRANNGTFTIGVKIQPRLQSGHQFQLLVDGNPYGTPTNVPRLQVVNIDRGEHSFAVVVMSSQRIIQQSQTITLTVQRIHVNRP